MKKSQIFALALALLLSTPAFANHGGQHIVVKIDGLVCDFCARSMEKVFGKKDPVETVKVDLTEKTVTISLKKDASLDDAEISKGVLDAGYKVVNISRD